MLFRQLRITLAAFVGLISLWVVGYAWIEGWTLLDSLWMVVITISTIGYGEVNPLSDTGRVFTMVLILIGLSLGAYTATEVTRYFVEGELLRSLRDRRLRKIMRQMRDHYIVVGYGRLGREVAEEVIHRGREVVVIETKEQESEGVVYIHGDGASDDVLHFAGIETARGIAVCTGNNASNVFITMSARQLNPKLHIITRVDDDTHAPKALRAGADAVLNPYGIGGARIAQGLLYPSAAALLDRTMGRAHDELYMEDIVIGDSDVQGSIRNLRISERFKVLIVAVRKPDGAFETAYESDATLDVGDVAVVVGRRDAIKVFAEAVHDPTLD